MDLSVSAGLGLLILAGGFLFYRRANGPVLLYFLTLALGYFSAVPAGWINGWIKVIFSAAEPVLLFSALVEEGIKVALLGLLVRRSAGLDSPAVFWLGGILWAGFGIFELLLLHLSSASLPDHHWMPLVIHFLLGLVWAGAILTPRGRQELKFIILVLMHGGFNLFMSRGMAPLAVLLTALLVVAAVLLYPWKTSRRNNLKTT